MKLHTVTANFSTLGLTSAGLEGVNWIQVPKLWGAQRGRCWSYGGGGAVSIRDTFILNDIWAQDKIIFY
jgi:hypothetical protein